MTILLHEKQIFMVKGLVKSNLNKNSEGFSKTSNEETKRIMLSYIYIFSFLKCKERKQFIQCFHMKDNHIKR